MLSSANPKDGSRKKLIKDIFADCSAYDEIASLLLTSQLRAWDPIAVQLMDILGRHDPQKSVYALFFRCRD